MDPGYKAKSAHTLLQEGSTRFPASYAPWVVGVFALSPVFIFFYPIAGAVRGNFNKFTLIMTICCFIFYVFMVCMVFPKAYTVSPAGVSVVNLIGCNICRTEAAAVLSVRRLTNLCEHTGPGTLKFAANPSRRVLIERKRTCWNHVVVSPCDPDGFVAAVGTLTSREPH